LDCVAEELVEAAQVDIQLFPCAVAVEDDAVTFGVVGKNFFWGGVFDAFVAAGADALRAHAVVGIQEDQVAAGKAVKAARKPLCPEVGIRFRWGCHHLVVVDTGLQQMEVLYGSDGSGALLQHGGESLQQRLVAALEVLVLLITGVFAVLVCVNACDQIPVDANREAGVFQFSQQAEFAEIACVASVSFLHGVV